MMSKLGNGATVRSASAMCRIWVLQASVGRPFSIMPHEPHTPMRQEYRQTSVASRFSLM